MSPKLSIDLEAELRKISQRQHLNQVHFMVALLRHALTFDPPEIEIQQRDSRVTLRHQGHPFSLLERSLLETVMNPNNPAEARQDALSKLEKHHGVAILSLFFNFSQVRIASENWQLTWQDQKLQRESLATPIAGYQIVIEGVATSQDKAHEELVFYAGDCDVPISFNGDATAQPFRFADPVLVLNFENPFGRGQICIPAQGDLSTVTFMKRGVRFGVTRATPESGFIYQACWSSHTTEFEGNFGKSIEQGFKMIERECDTLYDALVQHFSKLPAAHKLRVKRILAGAALPDWMSRFGRIPLFHGAQQDFQVTTRDLRVLVSRFGFLPYTTKSQRGVPRFVPRLLPEDVHFLRHHFKMQLSLYQGRLPDDGKRPNKTHIAAIEPEQLTTLERLFLKALNADDPYSRFAFAATEHGGYVDEKGVQHIRLGRSDQLVQQAVRDVERDATLALPWKFRLLKKLASFI